jgi:hypothetical protein
MKLCAFFHERKMRRKPPPDSTKYGDPLCEEALPADWVTDFLMPPFRDADAQETVQMELGAMDEGTAALVTAGRSEDVANQYWCDPGAYWNPSACGDDIMAVENLYAGMCGDLPVETVENALPGLAALSQMRLQPDGRTHYSDEWRLPFSPLKLE